MKIRLPQRAVISNLIPKPQFSDTRSGRLTHRTYTQPTPPLPFRHISPHVRRIMTTPMMTTTTTITTGVEPQFSANADTATINSYLGSLLRKDADGTGGRWTLTNNGKGLERTFKFKTFKKTWEFMNAVATICASKKHHPEWSNVYNTTFIRWTTHSPPGLSIKDVEMAQVCDEQAETFGEIIGEGAEGGSLVGKALADRVAVEGGDCCVPKKKL